MMFKFTCEVDVNSHNQVFCRESYIVARLVDGELWYWGAYDTRETAEFARKTLENAVILRGGI